MAAENAAEQGQTAGEYIVHHLTHLQSSKPAGVADFSVFNFGGVNATLQNKATVKKIGTTTFLLSVH